MAHNESTIRVQRYLKILKSPIFIWHNLGKSVQFFTMEPMRITCKGRKGAKMAKVYKKGRFFSVLSTEVLCFYFTVMIEPAE